MIGFDIKLVCVHTGVPIEQSIKLNIPLTYGKIYNAKIWYDTPYETYYTVLDDNGDFRNYNSEHFEFLENYREKKLNNLLNKIK